MGQTTKELTTDWEKQGRPASMNCCDLEYGDDSLRGWIYNYFM
jgi:hypothetical protein